MGKALGKPAYVHGSIGYGKIVLTWQAVSGPEWWIDNAMAVKLNE